MNEIDGGIAPTLDILVSELENKVAGYDRSILGELGNDSRSFMFFATNFYIESQLAIDSSENTHTYFSIKRELNLGYEGSYQNHKAMGEVLSWWFCYGSHADRDKVTTRLMGKSNDYVLGYEVSIAIERESYWFNIYRQAHKHPEAIPYLMAGIDNFADIARFIAGGVDPELALSMLK